MKSLEVQAENMEKKKRERQEAKLTATYLNIFSKRRIKERDGYSFVV